MLSYPDYLRLLPKTELHCHFVSTMQPETLVRLAERNGVTLPSDNIDELLDSNNLIDFLKLFNAAHDVLKTPEDFAEVAYNGVRDAIAEGNLRYREYYLNVQNFQARGMGYSEVVDPVLAGLAAAERDFGVGYGLVIAISRAFPPASAVELVQEIITNPRERVLGIGLDDLTPEGTESPELWVEAYALAKANGLRLTAHVGETLPESPHNILVALDALHCERIDHGYRSVDAPEILERLRVEQVPMACTPVSTRVLSGWELDPQHRIAAMIRAGLNVTFSTDDAVFFRTDIGKEYVEGLPAMGFGPDVAKRISLAGITASWADETTKARYVAEFTATHLALDALLES